MKHPVIAIGLDSADPVLLEQWMSNGHLETLSRLKQQGISGYVQNTVNYGGVPTITASTERLWTMTWSGQRPDKTGFWDTSKFYPEDYRISRVEEEVACNFQEHPPFYALGDDYSVAILDLPASGLCDQVNGVQILGWGGHFPFTPSHSMPSNALPDLIATYGKNEVLYHDDGLWSNPAYAQWLYPALKHSVDVRTTICQDLIQRRDWDLFITTFPETHSAGHDLLHVSQSDHPLYAAYKDTLMPDTDPVLDVFQEVDQALGKILANVPEDAYVFCFSVHGMGNNITDLLSMAMLPELMYRFNFPGKVALAPGNPNVPPPPPITRPIRNSWSGEIWVKNHTPNPLWQAIKAWMPKQILPAECNGLASPWALEKRGVNPAWIPGMWYSPLWPKMRAFALPAFVDGQIRVNLKGRERDGIVDPSEYDGLLEEITAFLYRLKHGRTGELLVDQVIRTRQYPTEDQDRPSHELPGPDLIVRWKLSQVDPADVVDSPDFGRVGPLPQARPGGHRAKGFFLAKGPGIEAGATLPADIEGVDIGPTILALMGAPIPERLEGKPISAIVDGITGGMAAV